MHAKVMSTARMKIKATMTIPAVRALSTDWFSMVSNVAFTEANGVSGRGGGEGGGGGLGSGGGGGGGDDGGSGSIGGPSIAPTSDRCTATSCVSTAELVAPRHEEPAST
eukprot:scaffold20663_cov66-Phaeocystis_antarctica.AAC.2